LPSPDDDQTAETEVSAALYDLGDPVDRYDFFFYIQLGRIDQFFHPSALLKTSVPLHGLRRPALSLCRGTHIRPWSKTTVSQPFSSAASAMALPTCLAISMPEVLMSVSSPQSALDEALASVTPFLSSISCAYVLIALNTFQPRYFGSAADRIAYSIHVF
jgi:hypothetical protein